MTSTVSGTAGINPAARRSRFYNPTIHGMISGRGPLATVQTLTVVGVGLVGGSVALAARRAGVARRILGVGPPGQPPLDALRRGVIDEATDDIAAAAPKSDLVVFATPVDRIAELALAAAKHCRADTLLTDVGSTKTAVVSAIEGRLPAGVAYVGGHPLAGSEKAGVAHANAALFQGRDVILTPTATTSRAPVDRVAEFWRSLGARVAEMSPEAHDRAMAWVSHVPHVAASALCAALPDDCLPLAARGFRDTTRVAAGDPAVWTPILLQNRAALLDGLDALCAQLDRLKGALVEANADEVRSFLARGKEVRDALGD